MPARGTVRPGSVSDIILTRIRQGAGAAVPRGEIGRTLEGRTRRWLGQSLCALVQAGHIVRTPAGYRLADAPIVAEAQIRERAPNVMPEPLREHLAPILAAAHGRAAAGQPCDGAALLLRAAQHKVVPAFAAEDLRALADLMMAGGGPYRDLDLSRRAAA